MHKVLFVDDEPNILEALKKTLRKESYEFLVAHSASEAMTILKRETIQVVVSDEQMPGMSGSQLLAIMRQERPQTIRILLTGHASIEAATRAINDGAIYRFLTKPCNALDLAITIRRGLQLHELSQAICQLLPLAQAQTRLLRKIAKHKPNVIMEALEGEPALVPDKVLEIGPLTEELLAEFVRIREFFQEHSAVMAT
ncbi:MAG: response regulator [Sedimentisphaerales bacterium]|nr:response regulator [Sedimentisphaerales bacterium]